MFKVGSWYFVKAPYRGGHGMKSCSLLKEPVFQVIETNEGGSATKIRYVEGIYEFGQAHNQHVMVSAVNHRYVKEFSPSGNTRFQVGGKYRAINSGIIDCLKMRHGSTSTYPQYSALCNLIRGTGYKNGAVLEIHRAFHEIAPKVRGIVPNTNNICVWAFGNRPINLPGYMAAFFELVPTNCPAKVEYPSPNDTPELDKVLDEVLSDVDNEPELEFGPSNPEETEDQKLLAAIKYLLSTRDIHTGKRLRLGYLSETYSRDDIKTPDDIIVIAEARREEIAKYIEQQEREIRRAQETIKQLAEL